jgi:hypothetical protein
MDASRTRKCTLRLLVGWLVRRHDESAGIGRIDLDCLNIAGSITAYVKLLISSGSRAVNISEHFLVLPNHYGQTLLAKERGLKSTARSRHECWNKKFLTISRKVWHLYGTKYSDLIYIQSK